jgi:hypothetical protein
LKPARPAAAQKRVAAAHIRRRRQRQKAHPAIGGRVDAVLQEIDREVGQQRAAEIRVVEQVERVQPDLQPTSTAARTRQMRMATPSWRKPYDGISAL